MQLRQSVALQKRIIILDGGRHFHLLILFGDVFLLVPLELALGLLEGCAVLDEFAHELLLLAGPLLGEGLAFAVFDFLHEEGEVGVLLEVAGKDLIVLGQELLIVLLAHQVALVLHQLHVPHVELAVRLDLLDYSNQTLPSALQFTNYMHAYSKASS
jgi:hypothetical protein